METVFIQRYHFQYAAQYLQVWTPSPQSPVCPCQTTLGSQAAAWYHQFRLLRFVLTTNMLIKFHHYQFESNCDYLQLLLHIKLTNCISNVSSNYNHISIKSENGQVKKWEEFVRQVIPCLMDAERPPSHLLPKKYKNKTLRSNEHKYSTEYEHKSHHYTLTFCKLQWH
jgi:hypothetical protein